MHSAELPVAGDFANKLRFGGSKLSYSHFVLSSGGSKRSIAFQQSAATRRKVEAEASCRVRRSAATGALIAFMVAAAAMTPEDIIFSCAPR